jgi:Spy/CpxP family protein refolding chaperone
MSKTNRFEMILVVVTVLALGAGLMAGLLSSRLPSQTTEDNTVSPLAAELELSPLQRDQMKEIWEAAQAKVVRAFNDAQALQKSRDEEIIQMLSEEQKARFADLAKKYADRYTHLQDSREKVLKEAVENTKNLLNDKQKAKYQEILNARLGERELAPGTQPSLSMMQ